MYMRLRKLVSMEVPFEYVVLNKPQFVPAT